MEISPKPRDSHLPTAPTTAFCLLQEESKSQTQNQGGGLKATSLCFTKPTDHIIINSDNLTCYRHLNAGVDARLVDFDALPHAFWYDSTLPETIEANHMMADFFVQQSGR